MARLIALVGDSGSGKTTSIFENKSLGIKGLPLDSLFIIQLINKPLPTKPLVLFRDDKVKGQIINTTDTATIVAVLKYIAEKRPDVKNIVIDDFQWLMGNEYFFSKAQNFAKYEQIGKNVQTVIMTAMNELPENVNVYITSHLEATDNEIQPVKMKTIGKMLDKYATLEGFFSFVLYCTPIIMDNKRTSMIITDHDGQYPAKSVHGVFEDKYMLNDLGIVDEKIRQFYN